MAEYMDKLSFAFAVAEIPLDELLIEHEPTVLMGAGGARVSCATHFAFNPRDPDLEDIVEAHRDTRVVRVFRRGLGEGCDLCLTIGRVLATAHPAPWKKGIGNG